jgi:alpha-L-fucosidase
MDALITRRHLARMGVAAATAPLLSRFSFTQSSPVDEEDERTAWFRAAKFGMFIHWGPYSLASVEASWPIMRPGKWKITEAEYRALPARFNPVKYDPDHFIDLARAAGQQYMVFTTKHHDGFCMFDSSYTNYKITKTPYGKDIVKPLADACARRGIQLGFYYSPPDMNHPGFRDTTKLSSTNWSGEPERPEWASYLNYMELQLTELLTHYGDCKLIWFDGLHQQEKYNGLHVQRLIRSLQSGTLINDRIGLRGDYVTPEQFVPKGIPTKDVQVHMTDSKVVFHEGVPAPRDFQLWETCMTINNTWAYNANDHEYKSSADLIRGLIEVTSRGGNFLLNIGPQPDGLVQPEFVERLQAIGDWVRVNGEAIYESTYGPIQGQANLRTTARGSRIYLHVLDWPTGKLTVAGLKPKVMNARLLANNQKLEFQQADGALTISLPQQAPDKVASVIALDCY